MLSRLRSPTSRPGTRAPQSRQRSRPHKYGQIIKCTAAAPSQAAIPHELPLFPVQPMGVFLPGMTKTLHLYEPHFISLVDDCLASEHRLMATAVLEPFMGEAAEAEAGPGAFVGGYNFMLSCGCLVQVLSAKPYTGGYLVRIRGEARLGISGLPQTGPYMRAQVYPLPDELSGVSAESEVALRSKVEQLRDIMRDVQDLASKFRCDETAALQQAMRWMYGAPITPGIQQAATATAAAAATVSTAATHDSHSEVSPGVRGPSASLGAESSAGGSSGDELGRGRGSDGGSCGTDGPSGRLAASASAASAGCTSSVVQDGGRHSGAGASGSVAVQDVCRASTAGGGGDGAPGPDEQQVRWRMAAGQGLPPQPEQPAGGKPEEEEDEVFDPEEAVRLSWAALQWLPHASTEERMYIVRTRLLAMDTRDVGRRLDLALEAMGRARASLAAKCAIRGAVI